MKELIVTILLALTHIGLSARESLMQEQDEELSLSGISSSQKLFVGMQEIAHSVHCNWFLSGIEHRLGTLSDTYRFSNALARVTFDSCILVPELRQKAEVISVRLSGDELNTLRHHFSLIRRHIIKIAERQGLESRIPLLVREANLIDTIELTASTMVDAFVDQHKENIFFKAIAVMGDTLGTSDVVHYVKEENLQELLYNFERIGPLASYIKVSKFNKDDNFRVEEIHHSLDTISPILRKAQLA